MLVKSKGLVVRYSRESGKTCFADAAKIRDQRTKWTVLQFSERKNADIILRETSLLPFLFSRFRTGILKETEGIK